MKPIDKLSGTLTLWYVPEEWASEVINYLYYGFPPGGFHTAFFANDLWGAAAKSHPNNQLSSISALSKWIMNSGLPQAFGSYDKVRAWLVLPADQRHKAMEDAGLLYTAWDILSNKDIA